MSSLFPAGARHAGGTAIPSLTPNTPAKVHSMDTANSELAETQRQLREALNALRLATEAAQQLQASNARLTKEKADLCRSLIAAEATILHQDQELADWERGKYTAVSSQCNLGIVPSQPDTGTTDEFAEVTLSGENNPVGQSGGQQPSRAVLTTFIVYKPENTNAILN